jgi:hypothetical protein
MKQKLILILILIIILITILDYSDNKLEFNSSMYDYFQNDPNIIITCDENYYYINIEDKSTLVYENKYNKKNKWLPKKYNRIKIRLN